MKRLLIGVFSLLLMAGCSVEINGSDSYYLVHGQHHIFKIFTPNLWVADMEYASAHGLASFFKPAQPFTENPKTGDVYIYAHGWDKANAEASLDKFIQQDQKDVLQKFKEIKISRIDPKFPKKNHVIQTEAYVIDNIPGRYRENCIYFETKSSIITIVYSGASKELYDTYKNQLDEFISRFEFLSSEPDEIRKILEEDMKARPTTKEYKVKS
jgi:penicillin-binding protein-related factor A (putative recombinase)